VKRTKRRYLALKLESDGMPSERELLDAIWASVSKLFGEAGASTTGLALISLEVEGKLAVLRCNLVSLPAVRASLAALTKVAGRDASVHVLVVSGTLKALFSGLD